MSLNLFKKPGCRSPHCTFAWIFALSPGVRAQLQGLVTDRNTPRKLVWRAESVLAAAEGHGTYKIMRRASTSKPTVWRWQERYLDEGVAAQPSLNVLRGEPPSRAHPALRHREMSRLAYVRHNQRLSRFRCYRKKQ